MIKVNLVTSPHVRHPSVLASDFAISAKHMYSFVPMGLLSLIASCRETLGITPQLKDINRAINSSEISVDGGFYDSAASFATMGNPDVIGFMTECDSFHHVIRICERIHSLAPDSRIILGGPHASVVARETLLGHAEIDAVVIGEAEISLPQLLLAYSNSSFSTIAGVMRKDGAGRLLDGGPPKLVPSLDDLPMPAFDLYNPLPGEELFLEVGRGCPFKCSFCSTAPYWHRRHRVKSPSRILFEIKTLRERFNVTKVHFTHDMFTTDKKWVSKLCDALEDSGRPVEWTCSARADTVDRFLLNRMKKAGCGAIYFGIESGSQRVLKINNKAIPIEISLEAIDNCLSEGIRANAGFIVGFPDDNAESIKDTFSLYERCLRLGARPVHIFGFCPFPGSPSFANLTDLEFYAHFVDLPLPPMLHSENLERIAQNPFVYASYYRPSLNALPNGFMQAIDEFSPLVEAALVPSLHLADAVGGLHEVYLRWITWIHDHNARRGAPAHRLWYGSPVNYCNFLAHQLRQSHLLLPGSADVAEFMELNHRVSEQNGGLQPTAMSSYRSFQEMQTQKSIRLGSRIRLGSVIDVLALRYDPAPALAWEGGAPLPNSYNKKDTGYAWQRHGDSVRLLQIPIQLVALVKQLQSQSVVAVGEFIASQSAGSLRHDGFDAAIKLLEGAASYGLLEQHYAEAN